ncbi:alpha/beta hydrolase [Cyanobium sp. FGCU-6]|nr:alpha/beta hydrolase [Cyanobium sp. FGCU6]
MPRPLPLSRHLAAPLTALLALAPLAPVRAIERIELQLPVLETSFTVNVSELRNRQALLSGNSDLAELDQATGGAIGRRLVNLLDDPLPLSSRVFGDKTVGSPLGNQALLLVSALVRIDGINGGDSTQLRQGLERLDRTAEKGSLTLLDVLEAIPGNTATIDLEGGLFALQRLKNQQLTGDRLISEAVATTADPSLRGPGPLEIQRSDMAIRVTHRPEPLSVVVVAPRQGANGRLVVISHGLWDSPENFEGWAAHLARHGYTVLLPRHPGSDSNQQQAMLEGKVPPPSPDDLRLRPLDVSAAIDAAAAGQLRLPSPVRTDQVVALGHSWGATTVLQLAGARPSAGRIDRYCNDLRDPERNLSWVLQCSFRSSANRAVAPDPRIKAVVAVSPPSALLFDRGSSAGMNGRVLMVSGSRDWVVPSGPEAIRIMAGQARSVGGGHRLVLVKGGDHFNLRSPQADGGGPLRGLLLSWTDGAFQAGPAAAPGPDAPPLLAPSGWGDPDYPLVDVTGRLASVDITP